MGSVWAGPWVSLPSIPQGPIGGLPRLENWVGLAWAFFSFQKLEGQRVWLFDSQCAVSGVKALGKR